MFNGTVVVIVLTSDLVSVGGFTSSNADTASTSDAPLPDPPTTQKAKRARTSPATSKVSHKKDLDSKKNVLCRLMELPVEIFTEIASLAQPGDLLSLARCCKGLREMLMTTSAAHIWHSAEGNVEGLPHCPEGMYEPQYAALLFTKLCTVGLDTLYLFKSHSRYTGLVMRQVYELSGGPISAS
ncbi:hypothetical protein BDV93DRAFT_444017 [Ceratobasidium sp. AG-I]|nr:hypothetical protein BDV93DRAFT_444017 [Ceratobasidium sp. AG-I]